jgi:hypothetical protein
LTGEVEVFVFEFKVCDDGRWKRLEEAELPCEVEDRGWVVCVFAVPVEERESVEVEAVWEWYVWESLGILGFRALESVRERPFFHIAMLLGVLGVVGVSVGDGGRLCIVSWWCIWAKGSEFRKECVEEAVTGVGFE